MSDTPCMRSITVGRAAILTFAITGSGFAICPIAAAAPSGEVALCFDGDVRVSAWQASQADARRDLIPGTLNMNATDGLAGPKQAYFHWRNLTTGAAGEAHGMAPARRARRHSTSSPVPARWRSPRNMGDVPASSGTTRTLPSAPAR